MSNQWIIVRLNVDRLAYYLTVKKGVRYIRVKDLAIMLGISPKSAGKLLARMESMGLAVRYSNTVYRLSRMEEFKKDLCQK